MQNLDTIKAVISEVQFNDWTFRVDANEGGTPYLQVIFRDKDRITGQESVQRCRKWMLSYHMVNSEIVRTAFMAVNAAMAHEVQEAFKYKGVRIFNPHLDLDTLAEAISENHGMISLRDETTYNPTVV